MNGDEHVAEPAFDEFHPLFHVIALSVLAVFLSQIAVILPGHQHIGALLDQLLPHFHGNGQIDRVFLHFSALGAVILPAMSAVHQDGLPSQRHDALRAEHLDAHHHCQQADQQCAPFHLLHRFPALSI